MKEHKLIAWIVVFMLLAGFVTPLTACQEKNDNPSVSQEEELLTTEEELLTTEEAPNNIEEVETNDTTTEVIEDQPERRNGRSPFLFVLLVIVIAASVGLVVLIVLSKRKSNRSNRRGSNTNYKDSPLRSQPSLINYQEKDDKNWRIDSIGARVDRQEKEIAELMLLIKKISQEMMDLKNQYIKASDPYLGFHQSTRPEMSREYDLSGSFEENFNHLKSQNLQDDFNAGYSCVLVGIENYNDPNNSNNENIFLSKSAPQKEFVVCNAKRNGFSTGLYVAPVMKTQVKSKFFPYIERIFDIDETDYHTGELDAFILVKAASVNQVSEGRFQLTNKGQIKIK